MARKLLLSSMCQSCRHQHMSLQSRRAFSSSTSSPSDQFSRLFPDRAAKDTGRPNQQTSSTSGTDLFRDALKPPRTQQDRPAARLRSTNPQRSSLQSLWQDASNETATRPGAGVPVDEPYHLNIYAHRHNMHITFTEPSRNPILSFSCGDIGLKKAQRGTYDAAYQLSTYTMRKMAEKQWRQGGKKMSQNPTRTLRDVKTPHAGGNGIEVVLRGYGPGREAFQKALLGTEGSFLKPLIVKVTDGTRLKFGGTRSPEVRRL